MRRIEVLPKHYPGLDELRGAILADDLDPELQAISEQAGHELGAPMAAVSLLLEHVQFFRGYHGLSPALEASRATDRDASFCQFVVRDATVFEVNDAKSDARVPQEMVERFGVAAYLGAPIMLGGHAVGAMCIADTKPRTFTATEREALTRLATAASKRLAVLAAQPRDRERMLHEHAVRPAFGELRNRLTPVLGNISLLQVALTEQRARERLLKHAIANGDLAQLALISPPPESVEEVQTCLDDLASDTQAIAKAIVALERASTMSTSGCALEDVIDAAITLAHHRTKLVGGVLRPARAIGALQTSRPVAISALSAALSGIAEQLEGARSPRGIAITVLLDDLTVHVRMSAALDAVAISIAADHLRLLLDESSGIEVRIGEGIIELAFPLRLSTSTRSRARFAAAT